MAAATNSLGSVGGNRIWRIASTSTAQIKARTLSRPPRDGDWLGSRRFLPVAAAPAIATPG